MNWIYYVKEPQHWESSPSGYFIVQEESNNGRSKYVVYKGSFKNWTSVGGGNPELEKVGEFATVRDAKKDAPYQPAA